MKHNILMSLTTLFLFGATTASWADIPPFPNPKPQPPIIEPNGKIQFVMEVDNNVNQPHVIIPRELVAEAPAPTGGAFNQGTSLTIPTIVAGICLSLALISGGLCLARRRSRKLATVYGLFFAAAVGIGVAVAMSNSFLQANAPVTPPKLFNQPAPNSILVGNNVQVSFAPRGANTVRLIINQQMLQQMANMNNNQFFPVPPGAFPQPGQQPKSAPAPQQD